MSALSGSSHLVDIYNHGYNSNAEDDIYGNPITPSAGLWVDGTNQLAGKLLGMGDTVVYAGDDLTVNQIQQNSLTIEGTGTTSTTAGLVTLADSGMATTSAPDDPNDPDLTSTLNSLSIDNDGAGLGSRVYHGTLDINNRRVCSFPYGTGSTPYGYIADMIRAACDGLLWDQPGITSTLAKYSDLSVYDTHLNIGLEDFTPGLGGYPTTLTFENQTVGTNSVLVRLTYHDDLVLAGDMSQNNATSDALIFAANYGVGTTWSLGNITHHTGVVNASDALIFAANYATGLAPLSGTGTSYAHVLFWDPNQSAGGNLGGTVSGHDWNATDAYWYDPRSGQDVAWNSDGTENSDVAIFVGTGGTVDIDGAISAGTIIMGGDGYDFEDGSSGSIALVAGDTIGVAGGMTTTIGVQLTGIGDLVKVGYGTLVISGTSNDYSGTTTVSQGTLKAGASDVFGSQPIALTGTLDLAGYDQTIGVLTGSGTITNSASTSATLTISQNGNITLSGTIQDGIGGLALTITGGTVTAAGTDTFTGDTTINGATLVLDTTSLGGEIVFTGTAGVLQLESGGTLAENISVPSSGDIGMIDAQGNPITIDGDVSGDGTLIVGDSVGGGTVTLEGHTISTTNLEIEGGSHSQL